MPLLECVPNFSEGRDQEVIRQITQALDGVAGARVLHVDPGQTTNRTVVTLAGEPAAVAEAAFRGIRVARDLIDMRKHSGEHPRMGATDVCPLVPIAGVTMEAAAALARTLGERVGRELGIPVYLYDAAQPVAARRNLADIRAGEYEGLPEKMKQSGWAPDYGPGAFNPRSGATVIGARDFLVAYNINLNTTSTRRANAVAFDVREAGRPAREGDPLTGKVVTDAAGNPVMIPGSLKSVKAIGWFIAEYGIAQVSMNLTNLGVTPIHVAFEEVCRRADARGMRVTGSELVGLVPLEPLLAAGRHFLRRQQRSLGVTEGELIRIAVKSLGLEELGAFKPEERILEYRLRQAGDRPLVRLSLQEFANETASESPAPGGGSVAAAVGALGAALGTMVANLSAHKRGWDSRWETFSAHAEEGQRLKEALLRLVDDDTRAFNDVMAVLGMPKATPGEQAARRSALGAANRRAIEVPFEVMKTCMASFPLLQAMAESGNPASVSDAGVGALATRAAVHGAWLNVKTNLAGMKDRTPYATIEREAEAMAREATAAEGRVLAVVERVMSKG
jgi:glutamate formiminotransferase / formiminotetrahydrofolate cyclodeaminase